MEMEASFRELRSQIHTPVGKLSHLEAEYIDQRFKGQLNKMDDKLKQDGGQLKQDRTIKTRLRTVKTRWRTVKKRLRTI